MNQYQKIEQALRNQKCTTFELQMIARSTCPWKRCSELKAKGVPIVEGWVKRGKRTLRAWWIENGYCENCGNPNPPGRKRKYCSDECRAKAWRERNGQ